MRETRTRQPHDVIGLSAIFLSKDRQGLTLQRISVWIMRGNVDGFLRGRRSRLRVMGGSGWRGMRKGRGRGGLKGLDGGRADGTNDLAVKADEKATRFGRRERTCGRRGCSGRGGGGRVGWGGFAYFAKEVVKAEEGVWRRRIHERIRMVCGTRWSGGEVSAMVQNTFVCAETAAAACVQQFH